MNESYGGLDEMEFNTTPVNSIVLSFAKLG